MSEKTKKKNKLALQENIEFRHLLAFFFLTFAGIALMSFVSFGQDIILNTVLRIPLDEQGQVAGNLQAFREIILIISIVSGGILADKISRRFVVSAGFLAVGLGFFLFPYAQNATQLMIFYSISGVGAAFITGMMTTLLADYILPKSRGMINGFQGVMIGFGAMLTLLLFKRLPKIFVDAGFPELEATRNAYFVIGSVSIAVAIILWFTLYKGKPTNTEESQGFFKLLKEGLRQGQKPGIALSYYSAFISRGDLLVVGTFLSLWLTQESTKQGMSVADASAKTGLILLVGGLSQMFLGPLIGWLFDLIGKKSHRVDALALASIFGGVAYCSFYFIESPLATSVLYLMILVGVAQIAGVIASQVLVAQQAPIKIRGTVIGFFGICGGASQVLLNWLGGILYSNWSPQMAFVLIGLLNFSLVILCFIMRPFIENNELPESS